MILSNWTHKNALAISTKSTTHIGFPSWSSKSSGVKLVAVMAAMSRAEDSSRIDSSNRAENCFGPVVIPPKANQRLNTLLSAG